MMTKTNTNKKSSTMARVALGATAVLALAVRTNAAGASAPTFAEATRGIDAAASGEDACTYLAFDDTTGALVWNGDTTGATTGLAVKTGAANAVGFDDCETAPGYYLRAVAAGTDNGANLVIHAAPSGWFAAGGVDIQSGTPVNIAPGSLDATTNTGLSVLSCKSTFTGTNQAFMVTAVPASANTDCKTKAGYYVSATTTANSGVTIIQAPVNKYAAGGIGVSTRVASTVSGDVVDCPYAGTSPAGSSLETQCTPKCNVRASTGATASEGTCKCAAGFFGSPLDEDGATALQATYGCTSCQSNFPQASAGSLTSAVGSTTANSCKTTPGFSLYGADNAAAANVVVSPTVAGKYNTGGIAVWDGAGVDPSTNNDQACPFASTGTGKKSYQECVPDCATTLTTTGAVVSGGTCVCSAGYQGSPKDANDAEVLHAVGGCTACPSGWSSVAGGTCMKDVTVASTTTTNNSPAAATPGAAPAASGASSVSVFAAAAAIAAAQLVL